MSEKISNNKKPKSNNKAKSQQIKIKTFTKGKEYKNTKEKFPHFMKYLKSGHPALIVGEQKSDSKDEYHYRKVTHREKDGKRANEKVEPNPNKTDSKPMYIGRRIRHNEKKYFSKKLLWEYPQNGKKK